MEAVETTASCSLPFIEALRLLKNSNKSGAQAVSSLAVDASSPNSAMQNADKSGIASITCGGGVTFFGAGDLILSGC